jgi:hypothetical protein
VGKEATALLSKGFDVSSISFETPKWSDRFTYSIICNSQSQFKRAIEKSDADIFHVHNTPDWLVTSVREATNRPIVYDIHDPEVMRLGKPGELELEAHEACNATVYPSDTCRIFTNDYFKQTKPSITLYPYVNEMYKVNPIAWPSWDSIVYEGGMSDNEESYRYYLDLFMTFAKLNFNVFAMPSGWATGTKVYTNRITMLGPYTYESMLRALRSFGFGIVGSQFKFDLMHAAMPNKLFEYIHCGVVPLVFNMGEAATYVTENKIGLDMTALAGRPDSGVSKRDMIKMGRELRKNVLAIRKTLYFEDHIMPLINLYRSL